MSNNTTISIYLSFILRHKPEEVGIILDEHGWADVDELIAGVSRKYQSFFRETLEEIVRTDEKQRYSFNSDGSKIRANQGHSIKVDVELEEMIPPVWLYHGTGRKFLNSINDKGLISKSRLYVHLSSNMETAVEVGKRHGEPVVFLVSTLEMYNDGHKFYLSKNGVWLTESVPPKYLSLYHLSSDVLKED